MSEIASLDVYYGGKIIEYLFTFSNEEPKSEHFTEMQIENTNFLTNSESAIVPLYFALLFKNCFFVILNNIAICNYNIKCCRKLGLHSRPYQLNKRKTALKYLIEAFFDLTMCWLL